VRRGPMKNIIEIRNVKKSFETYETPSTGLFASFRRKKVIKKALKGVSFSVKKGTITALLGKNGSGKSTLIKLLSGIMYPDSGSIRVMGLNPWAERMELAKRIGVVMGAHGQLYWNLPALDTFNLMRIVYKIPRKEFQERLDYLVKILELEDVYKRQVRTLSLGEQMKCNFVASVLHMPELIILDEPTIGVDLPSKQALRTAIESIKERGTTFLLTTHIVEDLSMAEDIFVLDRGELIYGGTRRKLEKYFGDKRIVEIEFEDPEDLKAYSKYGRVIKLESNYIKLEVDHSVLTNRKFVRLLSDENINDYCISERDLGPILMKLYASRGKR
jgi:ABC-2 type transport system ATP-binding protein